MADDDLVPLRPSDVPLPRTLGGLAALAVTYVVSPLSLPLVALGASAHALGASGRTVWTVLALTVVFTALVPLALLVAMVRGEEAQSLEVRERAARWKPLLVGALSTALLGVLLLSVVPGVPRPVGALTLWQAATTLVALVVTLRWKISLHALAVAGTLSLLAWLHLALGAPVPRGVLAALTLAVPLVAWARLRLGAHTPAQVAVGTLAGLVLPPLQLAAWAG